MVESGFEWPSLDVSGGRAGTVKKGVFKGGAEAVLRALRMVGGGTLLCDKRPGADG